MRNKKGLGILEVIVGGLIVTGVAMGIDYLKGVKDSGKQESELEVHEQNVEIREETDEELKDFTIQQERFNIEDREMIKRKASPKERNSKALKRWGK